MGSELRQGNFVAVTADGPQIGNWHTAIYEDDYKGLLIALCNQNGRYPHQAQAILNGLDGKRQSVEAIATLQQRVDELTRERDDALGHAFKLSDSVVALNERAKAAEARVSELEAALDRIANPAPGVKCPPWAYGIARAALTRLTTLPEGGAK